MNNRNAPCPCGSGKKHKKCCLILTNQIAPVQRQTVGINKKTIKAQGAAYLAALISALETPATL